MATSITVNLDDADEATLTRLTTEHNTNIPPPPTQVTPAQFFRQHIREWIRSQATRFLDRDQIGMRAAYNLATTEERATIDVILTKYR